MTRKFLAHVLSKKIVPMNSISLMRCKPNVLLMSWCNYLQPVELYVMLNLSTSERQKGGIELVIMACIGQGSFKICPCSPVIGAKRESLIPFLIIRKKLTIPIIWWIRFIEVVIGKKVFLWSSLFPYTSTRSTNSIPHPMMTSSCKHCNKIRPLKLLLVVVFSMLSISFSNIRWSEISIVIWRFYRIIHVNQIFPVICRVNSFHLVTWLLHLIFWNNLYP